MRQKKQELCAFLMFDYKAIQELLNRRAGEGWAFAGMRLGLLARYARCEPGEYHYFLDWCDPIRGDEGYLELCADAGWELIWEQGYLRFFRSRPGEDPAPIQTDGALEYQRFRKKALRRMALSGVLLLLTALFNFLMYLPLLGEYDVSVTAREVLWGFLEHGNTGAAVVLLALPALVGLAVYLVLLAHRLLQWQGAARRGEPLPVPSLAGTRARGALQLLCWLCTVVLFFAILTDMAARSPAFTLPVLIGVTIGILLSLAMRAREQSEFAQRYALRVLAGMWACFALALGCYFLFPGLKGVLLLQAPQPPIFQAQPWIIQEQGSFFLSHQQWVEGLDPAVPAIGSDGEAQFWVSRCAGRWEGLGALCAQIVWADAGEVHQGAPLPTGALEEDGVWEYQGEATTLYLLRRGNAALLLSLDGEKLLPTEEILAAAEGFLSRSPAPSA